jgi:COP9 signalosome complex subunit 6
MSIADHATRVKMQDGPESPCIGVILGRQTGLVISLLETFELGVKVSEDNKNDVTLAKPELEIDLKLFDECYPSYELLGWYTTGTALTDQHAHIHKQIKHYNERPLFVLMDPSLDAPISNKLPMAVYQHAVAVGDQTNFVELSCTIVSDEGERVTMVHCANTVQESGGQDESQAYASFLSLRKALDMLCRNIRSVHGYIQAVDKGTIPRDQAMLRKIKGLCNRLPLMRSEIDFLSQYEQERDDATLVTLLASVTHGNNLVREVMEKYNSSKRSNKHSGDGQDYSGYESYLDM